MGYNPLKQPEIAENTSFVDLSRVLYLGSQVSKSSRVLKIICYNPRKRLEIAKNMGFADPSRVMYRGLQGIEILPGLENHGL